MNIDIENIHNSATAYIEEKLRPIVESIGEPLEGHIFDAEIFLPKRKNVIIACQNRKKALEIGFNSGYSAVLILLSNPQIQLTCVDIAWHRYTIPCYKQLKQDFGDRIQLLVGDSRVVVPTIVDEFDLVHIDGGHTLEIAKCDIINTNKLLMKDATIIMDDVNVYDVNHGLGNLWLYLSAQFAYEHPSFPLYQSDHQNIKVKNNN
jgi:predicted O-methyltransferase YrrM